MYVNLVSVVNLDEIRDLGIIRFVFTLVMVILVDYEGFYGDFEDGFFFDDFGIIEDIIGIDEESENCEVDLRIELVVLKKKIV